MNSNVPFYIPLNNEQEIFQAAAEAGMAILLKGPTGCGKTRFVEYMAARLGRGLTSVACHEDLTAADLIGRHLLIGGETVWVDGPLTWAVRNGAICYLDEIVEARQDTIVVLHPLSDHRRQLPIDRLSTSLDAADGFLLVMSYNPGYQSILKDLKPSTRQRMVAITLGFPLPEIEEEIVMKEANVDADLASKLVSVGQAIRRLNGTDLKEVASTRVLISAGRLIAAGIPIDTAVNAAIIEPLTDDGVLVRELGNLLSSYVR